MRPGSWGCRVPVWNYRRWTETPTTWGSSGFGRMPGPMSYRPAACDSRRGLQLSLKLTNLDPLFPDEALFSAYSVLRGKPHPDLFLHAAASMRAEPSRCAVIEDTPSGVTAAVAAGMHAFGYAADSDPAALRQTGAEVFGAMEELPGLLGFG